MTTVRCRVASTKPSDATRNAAISTARTAINAMSAAIGNRTRRPGEPRMTISRLSLHVAQGDRLPQSLQRVAGGDELLADVALVVDLQEGFHDRFVVDLLLF